jgi:hypothetical protein
MLLNLAASSRKLDNTAFRFGVFCNRSVTAWKDKHYEGIPLPVTEGQVGVRKRGRSGIHLIVSKQRHFE